MSIRQLNKGDVLHMKELKRENVSGLTIEEYREWMKESCPDIHPRNNSVPLEMLIDTIRDVDTDFSAFDPDDYAEDMHIDE